MTSLKILEYVTKLHYDPRHVKIMQTYVTKRFFMAITTSVTSHGLKVCDLHSFINEITTFIMITKKRTYISSINLLYIRISCDCSYICIDWCSWHPWYEVLRSENKPKFWTLIPPTIFELQHRSYTQNVWNCHGYLTVMFNLRYKLL